MTRAVAAAAFEGDTEAIEVMLKISDRRAKLLGLYAPERHLIRAEATVDVSADIQRMLADPEARQLACLLGERMCVVAPAPDHSTTPAVAELVSPEQLQPDAPLQAFVAPVQHQIADLEARISALKKPAPPPSRTNMELAADQLKRSLAMGKAPAP